MSRRAGAPVALLVASHLCAASAALIASSSLEQCYNDGSSAPCVHGLRRAIPSDD